MPRILLLLLALGLLPGGFAAAYADPADSAASPVPAPAVTVWSADENAIAISSASGLKYVDVSLGEGDALKPGDVAVVDYTGWLTDGTKFDSSLDPDPEHPDIPPAPLKTTIPGRVIAGWNEGLMGMHVGGVRKLYIPPTLAYGKKGAGDVIPPDATLIFEVTLVALEKYQPWTKDDDKGAVKLKDGLKYSEMRVGTGEELVAGMEITCHYLGWLTDGTLFDSSLTPGRDVFETEIPGGVIEGWNQGLIGMKVGGWRKLYIPARLAYGDLGVPPTIPPKATLVFEVKLISATPGTGSGVPDNTPEPAPQEPKEKHKNPFHKDPV